MVSCSGVTRNWLRDLLCAVQKMNTQSDARRSCRPRYISFHVNTAVWCQRQPLRSLWHWKPFSWLYANIAKYDGHTRSILIWWTFMGTIKSLYQDVALCSLSISVMVSQYYDKVIHRTRRFSTVTRQAFVQCYHLTLRIIRWWWRSIHDINGSSKWWMLNESEPTVLWQGCSHFYNRAS